MDKPVPQPDAVSEFYWEGARQGKLLVQRCDACRRYQYPPTVVCQMCGADPLTPAEVSGRGHIYAFTVARQTFDPAFEVPFVLALVELEEDPSARILTNVVGCAPEDVKGGAPVEVTFEVRGEWSLPQFRLAGTPA